MILKWITFGQHLQVFINILCSWTSPKWPHHSY